MKIDPNNKVSIKKKFLRYPYEVVLKSHLQHVGNLQEKPEKLAAYLYRQTIKPIKEGGTVCLLPSRSGLDSPEPWQSRAVGRE